MPKGYTNSGGKIKVVVSPTTFQGWDRLDFFSAIA